MTKCSLLRRLSVYLHLIYCKPISGGWKLITLQAETASKILRKQDKCLSIMQACLSVKQFDTHTVSKPTRVPQMEIEDRVQMQRPGTT